MSLLDLQELKSPQGKGGKGGGHGGGGGGGGNDSCGGGGLLNLGGCGSELSLLLC